MLAGHSGVNTASPAYAADLLNKALRNTIILSTGCKGLDILLNDGLWTGEMVEICGVPGAGKTQLCKTVCANVVCETDTHVLFVDCCGSFVCDRFAEIVTARKAFVNPQHFDGVLSRIRLLRVLNAEGLLAEIEQTEQELISKKQVFYSDLRLVVVDSINALVSPILGGGQTQGHMIMTKIGRILKRLAVEHNLAVIVTNSAVKDAANEGYKPALGKTWKSMPSTRLFLQTTEYSNRYHARLIKSNIHIARDPVSLTIGARGVEDV
ncbi:DNA repair protein RAD51 homolog 4-like isoform X2 [Rhopilema esculentum]|uniref:DNA repair protein RAD51 homolog 4-like isoform X2 n=1 Tax=Rhopilema esculentum TaxID=499914 RepID=UPI0031E2E8D6